MCWRPRCGLVAGVRAWAHLCCRICCRICCRLSGTRRPSPVGVGDLQIVARGDRPGVPDPGAHGVKRERRGEFRLPGHPQFVPRTRTTADQQVERSIQSKELEGLSVIASQELKEWMPSPTKSQNGEDRNQAFPTSMTSPPSSEPGSRGARLDHRHPAPCRPVYPQPRRRVRGRSGSGTPDNSLLRHISQ